MTATPPADRDAHAPGNAVRPPAAAVVAVRVDGATGLLPGVRQVLSPFHDERPAGVGPELLVVHGISLPPGEFGGPWIDRLFCGDLPAALGAIAALFGPGSGAAAHAALSEVAMLRVSAHVLVRRDGLLVQYVPFTQRAWHAGASSWRGRAACNDYSIGVELEGADEVPYADAQYVALAALARALRAAYPAITADALVGHSDVAPGRKTDPGPAFDWGRLRRLLGDA